MDIRSSDDLARILADVPELGRGAYTSVYGSGLSLSDPPGNVLLSSIAQAVLAWAEDARTDDAVGGIRQYSLSQSENIDADDVRKAMFLSRQSTIFTRHEFELKTATHSQDDGTDWYETSWSLSKDFIRDVFRYRDLIEQSA